MMMIFKHDDDHEDRDPDHYDDDDVKAITDERFL